MALPGHHLLRRPWRPGGEITVHLDLTPRWTHPDRRVDAVRGCVAIERGPLVYCFEQADQPEDVDLADLAVRSGTILGERSATVPGIGQTVEVTTDAMHLSAGPALLPVTPGPPAATVGIPGPAAVTVGIPVTAVVIPYFQWDNRDGRAMRIWMPRADS